MPIRNMGITSLGVCYPFSPDKLMPPIMNLWAIMNKKIMGKETIVDPAKTAGQSVEFTSLKRAIPTVTGYIFQSDKTIKGQIKELHSDRKMKTPKVMIAGFANGNIMRQ